MAKFRIQPHGRLQEWVADELGYFKDEGLDYEFIHGLVSEQTVQPQAAEPQVTQEIRHGALEDIQDGRSCEVSSACHWMVNVAATGTTRPHVGTRLLGDPFGYLRAARVPHPQATASSPTSRSPWGIIRGVISRRCRRWSRSSTLPTSSCGSPAVRWTASHGCWNARSPPANVFGAPMYVVEQQGFRKIVDTTFMIGFLLEPDTDEEDAKKYFNALQRAQRDIDIEPERYRHYLLKELPATLPRPGGGRRHGRGRAHGVRALYPGSVREDPPVDRIPEAVR